MPPVRRWQGYVRAGRIKREDAALSGSVHFAERSMNMEGIEKVCQFLDDAGTYYLATVEGDQPRVRPFGTALVSSL